MSEKIVQLYEKLIKGQIRELVRGSAEEALVEMHLAGVSVHRVEDITDSLWGSKVFPTTISELNKKAYVHIKVGDSVDERLTYCEFPSEHWTRSCSNNVIERMN